MRWTGGAFGSLGFLCLFCFGASWPPSVVVFGFTVVPGFRPGFFRGRPAAVNWTGLPSGPVPTFADLAPTIISSISGFEVTGGTLGGDPGGEITEGGDESSGEDRFAGARAITMERDSGRVTLPSDVGVCASPEDEVSGGCLPLGDCC